MSTLAWICGASLLASGGAFTAAGLMAAAPEATRRALVARTLSYAVGTLLGAGFLGLLPRALEAAPPPAVLGTVLGGVVTFFVLEKLVVWRHCHDGECAVHGAAAPLILVGDTLHNFADGVVIAAAFVAGTPLGIATAVAVIAHELPQELGDFAILLDSGYSRARALALNALSGLASLAGALLAFGALEAVRDAIPYVLALSAASFLYIATADLIPGLHRRPGAAEGLSQVLLLLAGIGTVLALEGLAH
jgi:zinc and cadmium transporter